MPLPPVDATVTEPSSFTVALLVEVETPDPYAENAQSSSASSVTINVMDESFDLSTSSSLYLTAAPVTVYSLPTVSPL